MAGVFSRMKEGLKHSWNVFVDPTYLDGLHNTGGNSVGYYMPPTHRNRTSFSNERTIISSIYTRLGIDVSGVDIRHVKTDSDGRYLSDVVTSGLHDCLTVNPNLDQGPRQFRQDIAQTLFERGVIAIVPVETSLNPAETTGYDIQQLRVGEIVGWEPEHVRVNLYDQRYGKRDIVRVPKRMTAIVENPLYAVMNEPNSTLQRLKQKLSMLDSVDEASSSGKLDLIIQLPYVIKSDQRRQQAEQRRKDIEFQLKGSKYGIAYTDGTEKIQQLNRPVDNNLLEQIKYLTDKLYSELGLTPEVMNGTADEKAMLNYFSRTVQPVVQAITEAMKKAFLTKTARTQGHSILYFRDPFALVPMGDIAEIADKFTRNEILTSNEIRQGIGFKPSQDPKADRLVNSNMPQPGVDPSIDPSTDGTDPTADGADASMSDGTDALQNSMDSIDEMNAMVDEMLAGFGPDG